MVPRIIHQIWLGADPLPADFAGFVQTWRDHHPGWEHRLWTEENIPADLRHRHALERIRHPVERSDVLRLELLHRLGGVYVDVDFECRSSLDRHIADARCFTALLKPTQRPQRVGNAFIGAVPGHPLLEAALEELRPLDWYGFDKTASGSLFFNELVKRFPDVLILPPELVYPSSPAQEEEAICIHHAARSWNDAAGLRRAALRAEQRLQAVQLKLEKERRSHARTRRRLERLARLASEWADERRGEQ